MLPPRIILPLVALLALALLVACRQEEQPQLVPTVAATATAEPLPSATARPTLEPAATATAVEPTLVPTAEPAAATPEPTAAPDGSGLPPASFYDLGPATIIQSHFPADSPFHNMPVQLNGVIAAPPAGDGPYPVALVLHGTHPGCPVDDMGVDRWPCDPAAEQPNYAGFEYLVRELAAEGYVALAININGENTFGFGEAPPGMRLSQLVDLHMSALATAAAGGENGFGVELAGVADPSRLALVGHSRGGEMASWLTLHTALGSPLAGANLGYGPVAGILMIAPAHNVSGSTGANVPQAIILPACDGDVAQLDGQAFFEGVRFETSAGQWVTTALLERANHNAFNSILRPDLFSQMTRGGCSILMEPEAQRQFLVDYAVDFLTTLFSADPSAKLEALKRLGVDPRQPAPDELYGQPGRVTSLAAAADRLPIFVPDYENALVTNALGGTVTAEGATLFYCPPGYYTPFSDPGTEPCRRPNFIMPGNPGMLVVGWDRPATLRLELPADQRDLTRFTTLSLRAALDPLSERNEPGEPQSFSLRLTDGAGRSATEVIAPSAPALQFPPGESVPDPTFDALFSGLVHLTAIRQSLAAFDGVDLTDVAEIALVFDQTPSGTLFVADVDLSRPPQLAGAFSTLLSNADGANDALAGVGRFDGAANCTGTFLDVGGGADAPAYLITNGHCAQSWDANGVFIDLPAEGWSATFNYFADNPDAHLTVPAARVAYSTMKGRDVAIVELAATVGELQEQGITPLPLAIAEPDGMFRLRVVGAPDTGMPADLAYLREEQCLATGRANVFEFIWHFDDTFRNSCQDIYGGSSGSPVFDADLHAIVGLMNTTTVGGLTPCGLGSPCEVATDGTTWKPDTSYATPVIGLERCFAAGVFDPLLDACPLDKGRQLTISGYPTQGTQSPLIGPDGQPTAPTWNATLSGERPYYRYQIGRAGVIDCRDQAGYGPVVALAEQSLIDEPLPLDEGSYLLCVIAGESPRLDATWQPAEWSTVARVQVDNTPPTLRPDLAVLAAGDGAFLFEPIFAVPELVDYLVKFGPLDATECDDRDGYQRYRRIPFSLSASETPARVCVIGLDSAGNEGQPEEYELGIGNRE